MKASRSSLINNLPLFDDDKSLVACVDLFESEPAPAKHKLCKYRAYITTSYQGTQTSFLLYQMSRKISQKQCQTSECSSRQQQKQFSNFKSEFCSCSIHNTETNTFSPYFSSQIE